MYGIIETVEVRIDGLILARPIDHMRAVYQSIVGALDAATAEAVLIEPRHIVR